jgi:hypothetical protein
MATVQYKIVGGAPDYTATLTPGNIPPKTHTNAGTYSFTNVPDGTYTLTIVDANYCTFSTVIVVNPLVTTTTTTELPSQLITVGQAQDPILIFNKQGTNINTPYVGYPDPNNVLLYLWFQTSDGKPTTTQSIINFQFTANPISNGNRFVYAGVSDEIHTLVTIPYTPPTSPILAGTITLKTGFIESFVAYNFKKGTNPSQTDYDVTLSTSPYLFNTNIVTRNTSPTYLYGIETITGTYITMNFA